MGICSSFIESYGYDYDAIYNRDGYLLKLPKEVAKLGKKGVSISS